MKKLFSPDGDAGGASAGTGSSAGGTTTAASAGATLTQTPATTTNAPASATAAAASAPVWTEALSPDLKGYAEIKQFKDPSMAIDAYRNLEKLLGAPKEQLLKLPEATDSPDWEQVYTRLGKPEKPDGYNIPVPKEGGDEKFTAWAKDAFHKSNLTTKQAEALLQQWDGFTKQATEAQQAKMVTDSHNQEASLKTAWGNAYEQNKAIAAKAAKSFGVDKDTMDKLQNQMGYDGVLKFFHNIGSKLGEHSFVRTDANGPVDMILTPDAAKAKYNMRKKDKAFVAKYLAKDAAAVQEMTALIQQMNPEDASP